LINTEWYFCCSVDLSRTRERLEALEATIAGLEGKRVAAEAALHRAQADMKDAQDVLVATKKHSVVLQETLAVSVKEKDGVQRALNNTQQHLAQSNQENAELRAAVAELNVELVELKSRMAKESENSKKAMERAITASVRLCVVAPTVNVHVSDKKLKFKAGYECICCL
jgi:chromosome segregation ATPase